MKKFFLFIALALQSHAVICDGYGDFVSYNGHYYTTTKKRTQFSEAKALAENGGGYLAIPDTQAENNFLKTLIKGGQSSWIGIYDPSYQDNYCYTNTGCSNDDNRFKTVKGLPLSYRNWMQYQPDNAVWENDVYNGTQMVLPLGESWVAMAYTGFWQDEGNHASENNNPVKHTALIEFDAMPECYETPSTVTDQIMGKKCNTQIYDSVAGVLENSKTYDCQVDQYGNDYCPAALAACGEKWTYQDGYSVAVGTTTTDYTKKIDGSSVETYGSGVAKCAVNTVGFLIGITDERKNYTFSCAASHGGSCSIDNTNFTFDNSCVIVQVNSTATNVPIGGIYDSKYTNISGVVAGSESSGSQNGWCSTLPGGSCTVKGYTFTFDTRGYITTIKNFTRTYPVNMAPGDYLLNYIGGYDPTNATDKAILSECPGEVVNGICLSGAKCPDNYVATAGAEIVNGECKKTVNYTYYNYLCSSGTAQNTGGDCTKIDPSQTTDDTATLSTACNNSTPPPDNCKSTSFTCVAAPDRPCSYVNNSWQCSPFPCLGGNDLESTDTEVGINDLNNDGWDNNGNCLGKLYIFNGKDNRCRSDDALFGLFGGGCCKEDDVFFGLIQCTEGEKKLAKLKKNKQTHYVGTYCSKKIPVIGVCIQHKETHCAFNGKLARIINEQGRPQIGMGWGTAKSPNCRGFTPEEFQKLDFSEIDMSEFFQEIGQTMSASIIQNANTYIQTKVSGILNQ